MWELTGAGAMDVRTARLADEATPPRRSAPIKLPPALPGDGASPADTRITHAQTYYIQATGCMFAWTSVAACPALTPPAAIDPDGEMAALHPSP